MPLHVSSPELRRARARTLDQRELCLSRARAVALPNSLRGKGRWIAREEGVAYAMHSANMMAEELNGSEHRMARRGGGSSTLPHTDRSNQMDNPVITGFGVVGAPKSSNRARPLHAPLPLNRADYD